MLRKSAAVALAVVAALLVACTGQRTGLPGAGGSMLPAINHDLTVSAVAGSSVGEDLPSNLGSIYMPFWHALVGGFTQTTFSQTLAFPPGTVIQVTNRSKTLSHTFNVVMQVLKKPAKFPADPSLSMSKSASNVLEIGYASGIIGPGKSVRVRLEKAGVYMIGCAIHYKDGMRDIIQVSANAKPGPQATVPAPSPTSSGGGGGGGW